MRESGVGPTELATAVGCHRQNIYKIFAKSDIDTALLRKISIALRHDFFAEMSAELKNDNENTTAL